MLKLRRFNFNTIAALVFILLGVVMFVIIPHQVDRPTLLFGQAPSGLDPDLFPRLVAGGLILLGLWFAVTSFGIEETNGFAELDVEALVNVGVTLAVFVLYALLLSRIGFIVTSAAVIGALTTFYGNRNIWLGLLFSIGVPVLIFVVFTRVLLVSLPSGLLF